MAETREELIKRLEGQTNKIRRNVWRALKASGSGHAGGSLSAAETLAVLYFHKMNIRPNEPDWEDRDRFILSKGHAALALYAALHARGWIDEETLASYCRDDTLAGVHPDHRLPGVDFSTGSLGQGLSFGAGAALAAKLQRADRRVFVLVSDAECNEGSVWEAVMFAAHHRLSNLVAIVDDNGQQALDHTSRVLDLSPLDARWAAFGWETHRIDGHDLTRLSEALDGGSTGMPRVVLAQTVFGKGVSFMEGKIRWHYMPMTDEEYRQALAQIEMEGPTAT